MMSVCVYLHAPVLRLQIVFGETSGLAIVAAFREKNNEAVHANT